MKYQFTFFVNIKNKKAEKQFSELNQMKKIIVQSLLSKMFY